MGVISPPDSVRWSVPSSRRPDKHGFCERHIFQREEGKKFDYHPC